MEKEKWFSGLVELLTGMGYPARQEEERIVWAMAPGGEPDADERPVFGEMFLASSLGLTMPEDIDYLQSSVVFMPDIPLGRLSELREFCARLSRRLVGGFFSAHRMEESCFLEYACDIPVPEEAPEYQNDRLVETAVDLASAYITLCWDSFAGVCEGRMNAEQALAALDANDSGE